MQLTSGDDAGVHLAATSALGFGLGRAPVFQSLVCKIKQSEKKKKIKITKLKLNNVVNSINTLVGRLHTS